MKRSALALISLASLVGCISTEPTTVLPRPVSPSPDPEEPRTPIERIDLAAVEPSALSVEGIARTADGNVVALLSGVGLVELDADGQEVNRLSFYERGFEDWGFTDVEVMPNGKYALAAPNWVVTYDPEAELIETYFCLEPGWEEIVMENGAVTIDPDTDVVVGAPAYYNSSVSWEQPESAFHSSYGLDGTFLSEVDVLGSGVTAEGLAVDGDRVLAVDGTSLFEFQDGVVTRVFPLEGIEDASGLTLDRALRVAYVTDRADLEVRSFSIAD
jgi:hypothetical protein